MAKKSVRYHKKKHKKILTTSIVVAFLLGILGGFYSYGALSYIIYGETPAQQLQIELKNYEGKEFTTLIKVPAVDREGNGVATDLVVQVVPGTGKTYVEIDNLLYWADTQNSMRVARLVAENVTGIDTDSYDITYSISADAAVIGGQSAGAALAIATITALENKDIKNDVMITGAINHDGTIGPVGAIVEKAKASKEAGGSLLLVPLLQSGEVIYEENEHCEKYGTVEWCTTERVPKRVDVASEAEIKVIEVENIKDALEHFIS